MTVITAFSGLAMRKNTSHLQTIAAALMLVLPSITFAADAFAGLAAGLAPK